ncbi:hypothetical protein IWQ61_002056 [Dispira simplex]|nr:hypothetical protein IWQ61_002056 [Dispira simplex]
MPRPSQLFTDRFSIFPRPSRKVETDASRTGLSIDTNRKDPPGISSNPWTTTTQQAQESPKAANFPLSEIATQSPRSSIGSSIVVPNLHDYLFSPTESDTTCHTMSTNLPELTLSEERFMFQSSMEPHIYVLIFVNPLSGNRTGKALVDMNFQHFRLRSQPRVQVQWYNFFDQAERDNGLDFLQWVLRAKRKLDVILQKSEHNFLDIISEFGPVDSTHTAGSIRSTELSNSPDYDWSTAKRGRIRRIRPIEVHIWSAGGDGTVMSVYDWLVSQGISIRELSFSCIPFGTGNDFSRALGWGRSVKHNFVDSQLANLYHLTQARLAGNTACLDIWEVKITTYDGGYVRYIQRGDHTPKQTTFTKRFCSIFSMGVQGFVGSGFEPHRSTSRARNIMEYTRQSLKWVLFRKFPLITEILESVEREGRILLKTKKPRAISSVRPSTLPSPSDQEKTTTDSLTEKEVPTLNLHPIDLVIQNIPHIWGRDYDIWGTAGTIDNAVENRTGETDPEQWTHQTAGDGKLEMFCIENVPDYIRKQLPVQSKLARIGQFGHNFSLNFRHPDTYQSTTLRPFQPSPRGELPLKPHRRVPPPGVTYLMIDGEFYELLYPKTIEFRLHNHVRAIGSDIENSRLVRDTQMFGMDTGGTCHSSCSNSPLLSATSPTTSTTNPSLDSSLMPTGSSAIPDYDKHNQPLGTFSSFAAEPPLQHYMSMPDLAVSRRSSNSSFSSRSLNGV